MEILDAGIDVITTVNIQHLESIADAVEQMTGAQVRERVPDWVVRKADQIELVDSSPEALRRRMLHGNIYPKAKVPQALTHFFRTDNLIALRELALRFLADETEEELLEHLRRHQTGSGVGDQRAHPGRRHRRARHRRHRPPGRRAWPPASRPTSTSCTSSPATVVRSATHASSWPCCASWPPTSGPTGTSSRPTTPPRR